jgi:hypothetical protein
MDRAKKPELILGIDPGNKGAAALLNPDGSLYKYWKLKTIPDIHKGAGDMLNAWSLYQELKEYNIRKCYTERIVKNAKTILNSGLVQAVLSILQIEYLALMPMAWMARMRRIFKLDNSGNKNKEFTFAAFEAAFPEAELPIKGKGKDDDIADACLLAKLCYHENVE